MKSLNDHSLFFFLSTFPPNQHPVWTLPTFNSLIDFLVDNFINT